MSETESRPAPGGWKRFFRLCLGILLISAVTLAVRRYTLPSCETIQAQVSSWGLLAPLLFFFIYVFATIAFIPGLVVTLLGGLAFGPWWGSLLVSLASTTGATLAFLIARYVARDWVQSLVGRQSWFAKFKAGLAENGLSFVLFVRLVPLFPFNALNYACGLVPLRVRDYVLGSFLGMLPGTFAYVYLGETGCKLIQPVMAGRFHPSDMPADIRHSLFIAIGLLAFLSVLPVFLRRLRKGRPATGTQLK